jgi:hypothetical protein
MTFRDTRSVSLLALDPSERALSFDAIGRQLES